MKKLIHEIHRRSLWQVLGIYLVGSWIALQVVEQLAEAAGLPEWVRPLALVLMILGLPIVLATAFVQQGLPGSSSVEPPSEEPHEGSTDEPPWVESGVRRVFTWKHAVTGGVVAFAVWGMIAAGWFLLGGGAGAGSLGGSRPPESATIEVPSEADDGYVASVAVMPFDNLGGPDNAHISAGFTEEVNTQLARIRGLKVISYTSVVALSGLTLTLPEIADTLGVEHVLRGSVQQSPDQLRVTVELTEARTDAITWGQSYTRPNENLFDLQDEIAGEVSSALIQNVAELAPATTASRTVDSDAYEAYLRGRRAVHARTSEAFAEAIAAFQTAIEADPTYAPAYAGLASAYGLSITYGMEMELAPYERFREAISLTTEALELDPGLAEAYGARSYIELKARAPAEVPLADAERAVALLPNSADMRGWYAHSLARAGRHEEGMAQAQLAIELDPIAAGRRVGLALEAFAAGEYQVALDEARSALALQPGLGLPRVTAAYALLLLRRPAECLEIDLPTESLVRATCLYAAGQQDAATAIVDRAAAAARSEGEGLSDLARANLAEGLAIHFAQLGDSDGSLEWHELAFELSPDGIDFRFYQGGLFTEVRAVAGHEDRVATIWQGAWERVSGAPG